MLLPYDVRDVIAALALLLIACASLLTVLQAQVNTDAYSLSRILSLQASGFNQQDSTHPQSTSVVSPPSDSNISLPIEYAYVDTYQNQWCADRFGVDWLYSNRDSIFEYTTKESSSKWFCFRTQTSADQRIDSFCSGGGAYYDKTIGKFRMDSHMRHSPDWDDSIPRMEKFPRYWGTGGLPRTWDYLQFPEDGETFEPVEEKHHNVAILIPREGADNVWHVFMDILGMYMTLDTLRITNHPYTNTPMLMERQLKSTQIVILDDNPESHYFELWTMLMDKPAIRLSELAENTTFSNVIFPLPGGGNPFWQADWEIYPCSQSAILDVYVHRVLAHYNIVDPVRRVEDSSPLTLTYIDRRSYRRLHHKLAYLDLLRDLYPDITIQSIDFATLTLKDQIRVARTTDILVGVHGAGHTHAMFMRPGSTVVELQPETMSFKGFRNLAKVRGNLYYSAHVKITPSEGQTSEWWGADVEMEEGRFLELMDIAVKSQYNRGTRSQDVAR